MSIAQLVYLGSTFSREALVDCKLPKDAFVGVDGITTWIGVQMLFAFLNLVFAPYFQYKVWEKLYEESKAEELLQKQPEVEVEKEIVQSSFKHVFMTDFGVCFYFFALIASFAWSKYGFDWVTANPKQCNPDGGPSFAANLGWGFFFIAILYTMAWLCCSCCAKATVIRGGYEEVADADPELEQPLGQQ